MQVKRTVRTGHGTVDWFQIWKGVCQGLFKLCEEYIMQNTRLGESQARIKIARKDISNFRYADDTTHGRKRRGTKEHLDEGK